jgi:NAD(P)-dependent dehydrogenase (short-subunit alcohol dehydrogenase family)
MKAAGKGSIINLLTCAASTSIPPQFAYGSTKNGLHMLTRYPRQAPRGCLVGQIEQCHASERFHCLRN